MDKPTHITQHDARQKAALSLADILLDVDIETIKSVAHFLRTKYQTDLTDRKSLHKTYYIPVIPEPPEDFWWFKVPDINGPHLDGVSVYIAICKKTGAAHHYNVQ